VTGPFDPLIRPGVTQKLDYEVELGVVIGRIVHALREEDALSAVAGYVVVNDVSARDVQLAEGEDNTFYRTHYLGKSFDTFCPTGPWLVTPDELGDVGHLTLRTWVNNTLRQDGSTADLVFGVPALIAHLSSVLTLQPGDLICSGSPAGVAAFGPPSGFLVPGDVVRCEVGGIGAIENHVVAAAAS
jgi:2-keto-4-pentenoate hydratase/2-oxohepta-3-ene-1,7-dioic acid hydratase in catechol pathway